MPPSRAELRKAKRQGTSAESTPRSSLDIAIVESDTITITRTPSPIPPPIMSTSAARLFVASIGNPAPYLSTLHSAGHIVNHQLALALRLPPFVKSRAYAGGLLSESVTCPYTLWQSPSYMNLSGVSVAAAYKQFQKDNAGRVSKLVVLADELELPLGDVKVRGATLSHKGHNGLKSIKEKMANDYKEIQRVSIGIGRPASRESGDVANYVLKKMNPIEKMKIEGAAGRVLAELARIAG